MFISRRVRCVVRRASLGLPRKPGHHPSPALRGTLSLCAFVCLTCALCFPHGSARAEPLPVALDEAQSRLVWSAPEDPPTEELVGVSPEMAGRHYLAGDELNLHLFYGSIKDKGGAYAGVGSDQAYILIGWQRPEVAWLIDYDLWVSYTHLIHHALIKAADTPDGYLSLWTTYGVPQGLAAIDDAYGKRDEIEFIRNLYLQVRPQISTRLHTLRDRLRAQGVPNYLDDPQTYDFVRAAIQAGRVRPMVANLLETRALPGIAKALDGLGIPLRVLYLSNAEQYWTYSESFRANMQALPFDKSSLILRTLGAFSVNGDYRYNTQPALHFRDWLQVPHVTHVYDLIPRPPIRPDEVPFSHTDSQPGQPK